MTAKEKSEFASSALTHFKEMAKKAKQELDAHDRSAEGTLDYLIGMLAAVRVLNFSTEQINSFPELISEMIRILDETTEEARGPEIESFKEVMGNGG